MYWGGEGGDCPACMDTISTGAHCILRKGGEGATNVYLRIVRPTFTPSAVQ